MLSRENRVLLVALALVAVATAAVGAAGVGGDDPLLVLTVVAGLGVVAPQLYLAATGGDVSPRSRVRAAVVVSLLFAFGLYGTAPPDRRLPVAVAAGALLLGLVAYELLAGYRGAGDESEGAGSSP